MPEALLRTKLFKPPQRPDLVQRPRLVEKLNRGLHLGQKLTLISAPAGFGKTTLVSEWVNQQDNSGRIKDENDEMYSFGVSWLSLDETDDNPSRFWRYLVAACQSVLDGVGESALALLNAPQSLPDDTIPTLLINDFVGQDRALVLVLDDYHVIQNPSIHRGLSFLIDHLPANLHIVVSTRADPPWSLARYRAGRILIEIRAKDLRFSFEEAAEFLNQVMGLRVAPEDVAALEKRTEGWVAGLQLAAIAMQSRQHCRDATSFVQAFTGSHLYVAEYLIEEILQQQSEDIQAFLVRTSILGRLTAGLCDAVTGRQDGQTILTNLHRANLFIIPLDNEGQWYRYHHMFSDLLQARLSQSLTAEAINGLHKQAAAWYEQNGFTREAVEHALAARDFERVASLVENEARSMMFAGQARTLSNWLDFLPEMSYQSHPRLRIYRLWLELMQETSSLSPQALQEKENMLRALPRTPENDQLQLELLVVLCRFVAFSGNTARAIRLAEEAIARLPDREMALRARAYSALAVAYWMEGDEKKARPAHEKCMSLSQATGNYSLAAHAAMMMAMSQTDYGQLRQAARTYQSIIDLGRSTDQKVFFPAGQGYIGLAGIHLEWNDLEKAEDYLQKGMTLCRQGGLAGLSAGHTIRARLHQAKGDLQTAVAELEQLGETGVDPTGKARQILVSVAVGNLDEAARLAEPWINVAGDETVPTQPPLLISEIIIVTLAHLYLAREELEQAQQLLDKALATAVPGKRNGRLIEIFLLRSLVHQKQNQGVVRPEALEHIERALEMAEPEGYTLLFLEGGPDLIPLLQAVVKRQGTPARLKQYAQKLQEAFRYYGRSTQFPAYGDAAALVEPLTPREMEVLQLVATGDSNQAIADKLVITVRTVKKHITNILGKLGVSNRTQAVARARELGLITSE